MKKRLVLFGDSVFQTIEYCEGEYVPIYNKMVNELALDYNVSNFSFRNKPISFHLRLIKSLMNQDFDEVMLAVGEYETSLNPQSLILLLEDFKRDLREMINFLVSYQVKVTLLLVPGKSLVNKAILEIADEYRVEVRGKNVMFEVKPFNVRTELKEKMA